MLSVLFTHTIDKYLTHYSFHDTNISPYKFNYEPSRAGVAQDTFLEHVYKRLRYDFHSKYLHKILKQSYDRNWKRIIRQAKHCKDPHLYYGGFVDYDDSPRRGSKGMLMKGTTPAKFEKYLRQLLQISSSQNKEYVFITAWNEWGEGAYLEPDTTNRYAYLEALKKSFD